MEIKYWLPIMLTATIGFITFLFNKFIENFFNKSFEDYKHSVSIEDEKRKSSINKEIESFKSNLNLIHLRQSSLIEKRGERIINLYKMLVELNLELEKLVADFKQVNLDKVMAKMEEDESIRKISEMGLDFIKYYHVNKIFFENKTCLLIEEISSKLGNSFLKYALKRNQSLESNLSYIDIHEVSQKLMSEANILQKNLEDEFRILMGVES